MSKLSPRNKLIKEIKIIINQVRKFLLVKMKRNKINLIIALSAGNKDHDRVHTLLRIDLKILINYHLPLIQRH